MAAPYPSQEHRPLKKARLGPPDVYPQDPKQKEDELNQMSVKHGFSNAPPISDEYGSAGADKGSSLVLDKFTSFYTSVMNLKFGMNTIQDAKKKPNAPPKDNFWPAARSKQGMEAWFKDLAGSKPLAQLSKKVPTFNKKDEIFSTLCEYSVPLVRAAWFIKMTAAHNMATQDSRIRRRQAADQSIDWTQSLTKYLKEQLQKIQEYHSGPSPNTSQQAQFIIAAHASQTDMEVALKQWNYGTRLAKHMYNEGLLDRNETLTWFVELLEKMKNADETGLKLMLCQIESYIDEITLSALLSRRLAYFCCKYIQQMCNDAESMSPRTQSPMVSSSTNGALTTTSTNLQQQYQPTHPFAHMFAEYRDCPQHRSIAMKLCGLIQTITLRCPTALVWNWLGDGKTSLFICGSPLDILPCYPSSLPMLPAPNNQQIRAQIKVSEAMIRQRSRAAEVNWSSDKCQQSQTGYITSKVLAVLDILDSHCFELVDATTNNLDALYNNIFAVVSSKEGNEAPLTDEPVIRLLIDWAVSTQRLGEHRAIITAKLLERRQTEMRPEKYQDGEVGEDKEDGGSEDMGYMGPPSYQSLLMDFLDHRAPLLEEHSTEEQKQAFRNLILLFHELMQHDVFSHDAYMCTLISRGDLLCSPNNAQSADSVAPSSVKSPSEMMKNEPQDLDMEIKVNLGIHSMELDLNSIFGTVNDSRTSPEPPASVKSVRSDKDMSIPSVGEPHSSHHHAHHSHLHHSSHLPQQQKGPSRHLVYATHLPIPQEDCSSHEYNQRLIVLYGVGSAREEARRSLKKTTKEIVKLFSKKNCIDINSGDLLKAAKKKREREEKEGVCFLLYSEAAPDPSHPSLLSVLPPVTPALSPANLEALMQKFQKLSYHDQHCVTAQCTVAVLDQMKAFIDNTSSYLPHPPPVAFLFELMQHALNLNGLMTFVTDLLKMLCEVERHLFSMDSVLCVTYTTSLCLRVVSVLRRYTPYVLASESVVFSVFRSLMEALKVVNVCNPVNCSTEERNMLSLLYDLFTYCNYLKVEVESLFKPAYSKMTATLYAQVSPSSLIHSLNTNFMSENIRGMFEIYKSMIVDITDNPQNRYSFVCNAITEVAQTTNTDRLNQISIYCAQLTARCNLLTSDWLGVLKTLCCPNPTNPTEERGFLDVLTQIDVNDLSIHDNIAVFTAILLARHCFSLCDLVVHLLTPSLGNACSTTSATGCQDVELGARLTCHLCLRLFKPSLLVSKQSAGAYTTKMVPLIQEWCDRQLLAACHLAIGIEPLTTLLKALLILGDHSSKKCGGGRQNESNISSLLENLADGGVDMDAVLGSSKTGMESKGLNDFAKHVLQEICHQDWVKEKFLKNIDQLITREMLCDPLLAENQAHRLLNIVCYPKSLRSGVDNSDSDNKQLINRVLMNLDQWSLRVSFSELKLLLVQAATQAETNSILDHVARATIDLFHQQTETKGLAGSSSPQEEIKSSSDQETVWLVAPFISRLPNAIQGKVLKLAGQVLESGNNLFVSAKSKQEKDRNMKSQSLLGHQPFLSLVQTCLKGQDEQREGLLGSLMSQLEKFINNTREILEKTPDESKIRMHLHEALRLRLSLVGAMFDTIQRANATTSDWAMLLLQLISHEVVDCQTNSELFYTVIDMLSVLVLGTLISEGQEKLEDNKKFYHNLIKKLKKELGDKHTDATDRLRQLLPVPKRFYEVIVTEPYGTYIDSKGNTRNNDKDKKQGLQVAQKIKISPWEVIEGNKGQAPLAWSHFGAIRLEKRTLLYEDQHRLLLYHTHSLRHPESHYMQPPPLPPEELQPPPQKEVEEEKPKVVEDVQSQDSRKRKRDNRRRPNKPQGPPAYIQQTVRPYTPYPQEGMYPPPGPPNAWYNQTPSYRYPPGPMGQRPRYPISSGKSALTNMMQQRHRDIPTAQPGKPNSYMMQQKHHNQILLRQHILNKNPRMMDPSMYPAGSMPPNSNMSGAIGGPMMGQAASSMPPNSNLIGSVVEPLMGQVGSIPPNSNLSGPMEQGYYPQRMAQGQQGGMMDPMGGGMVSPGFPQSYTPPQGPMMQGMAGQSGAYMTQQNMAQGQQFPQSTSFSYDRMQPPQMANSTMQTPTTAMTGYNQMGPAQQHQAGYMNQMTSAQQMRLRQVMHMQQQQQPQQQGGQPGQPTQPMQQQQQQTAALVAQLQRRMSSSSMPGPPPPPAPAQYGQYGQY